MLFARRDAKPIQVQLDRLKENTAARLKGKERRRAEREREGSAVAGADQPERKQPRPRKPRAGETSAPEPERISDSELPETSRRVHGLHAASVALDAALLNAADDTSLRRAFSAAKAMGLAARDELATRAEVRLLELEIANSASAVLERQRAQNLQAETKACAAARARGNRRCTACLIAFSSVQDLAAHECFARAAEPSAQDGVAAEAAEPGQCAGDAWPEAGKSCSPDAGHAASPEELCRGGIAPSQGWARPPRAGDDKSTDTWSGTQGASPPHRDSTDSLGLLGSYNSESDEEAPPTDTDYQ